MSKIFQTIVERTYDDNDELITAIVDEFNDGEDVIIGATWEETIDILKGIVRNLNVVPFDIEIAYPEINGYDKEYLTSLCHNLADGKDAIFVEKAYSDIRNEYIYVGEAGSVDISTVIFVSQNININLYDRFAESNYNIVLFDVKE